MLLGAADNIAPPALCDTVAKGVRAEKLKVITYPNARHGFDMRGLPRLRWPEHPLTTRRRLLHLGQPCWSS
jgi:dienelactone hydrolase